VKDLWATGIIPTKPEPIPSKDIYIGFLLKRVAKPKNGGKRVW
jgi:hypothetical protein